MLEDHKCLCTSIIEEEMSQRAVGNKKYANIR